MPSECENALQQANTFPDPVALQVLADREVAYVVVDRDELASLVGNAAVDARLAECERSAGLYRVESASDDRFVLFELAASSAVGAGH
jgi:hypothetical protein